MQIRIIGESKLVESLANLLDEDFSKYPANGKDTVRVYITLSEEKTLLLIERLKQQN